MKERYKKLIVFCLWGTEEMYLLGAMYNLLLARKHYPDYICRYYIDEEVDHTIINTLDKAGAEVCVRQHVEHNLGMFWRFEPFWDNEVEIMLSRDTDSRISRREAAMVYEWEISGKAFHIIRDHPQHGIPILGGTFGARVEEIPNMLQMVDEWLITKKPRENNPRGRYHNFDQQFLDRMVWPKIKHDNMCHDNYFKFIGQRGNYTERPNNEFIGMTYGVCKEEKQQIKKELGYG